MKAKIWGKIALVIFIAIWIWFSWIWLVTIGLDSDIWECQFQHSATVGPGYKIFYYRNAQHAQEITYIILLFFLPMSIASLILNIFLIGMRRAKIGGIIITIIAFIILYSYMISFPNFLITSCELAESAMIFTGQCFLILSLLTIISGIVLIKNSKKVTIQAME